MVTKDKEIEPEPMPTITPAMVKTTIEALESKGMIFYTESGAYVPTERGWKLLMQIKPKKEEIIAYGHPNIKATDTNYIKITKDSSLNGDLGIVAIKSNKSCKDLSDELKNILKKAVKIEIKIEAGGESDTIIAYGSPALKLTNSKDIVIRKTDFIDNSTIAILADKSANELKQDLVEKLRNPKTEVKIIFESKI